MKDVLLWRNTSNALGLDLRETLIRTFEEAGGHTHCHEIHSLTVDKGYRRINAQLVGGQVPKNRSAASPKNTTQVGAGTDGAAGCQGEQQQPQSQSTEIAASEDSSATRGGSQAATEGLKTDPALFDHLAPCNLYVVPADAAAAIPHSRDAGQSLRMTQMGR